MSLDRQLQFVHIGKCGGSTVLKLLSKSPLVSQKYSSFFETHINGVVPSESCDYLFCIRNPIERAFSAFEWRKKLVLLDSDSTQLDRFPGEYDVLKKYESLGDLALNLYRENGTLNQQVARDFNMIHHLRESISFYIYPLMEVLSPENVFGVICQELMSEDCLRVLSADPGDICERKNVCKSSIEDAFNSRSMHNLKRFLTRDYQSIAALWSLGCLSERQFKALMLLPQY